MVIMGRFAFRWLICNRHNKYDELLDLAADDMRF